MKSEEMITDELRQWVINLKEKQVANSELVAALQEHGWNTGIALQIVEKVWFEHQEQRAEQEQLPKKNRVPALNLKCRENGNSFCIDGHCVQLVFSVKHPRVLVLDHLLTDEECDALIQSASPQLQASSIMASTGLAATSRLKEVRSSFGASLSPTDLPLVGALEARIEKLFDWNIAHMETLQLLNYLVGGEYLPHQDYLPANFFATESSDLEINKKSYSAAFRSFDDKKEIARGGQRVATLIMYLNQPEAGGSTSFPDAGLEFFPRKGSALFFSYDRAHPISMALHAGLPVLAGEKWIATKWFRESVCLRKG